MNAKWLFKDGATAVECTSFPYAFRTMFNVVKKGVEKGRKFEDMVKGMSIVSPHRDRMGDTKKYTYAEATQMAQNTGLLTSDRQINSREFKRF